MSKILVTGCNGYIGSHTVKKLAELGHEVHGLDVWKLDANNVKKYLSEFRYHDITTPMHWAQRHHYDAVIHLAAMIDVEESTRLPTLYYDTNYGGTRMLLKHLKFDHFVFSSTAAAFDKMSPYGISKVAAEDVIKEQCDNYTIFRFFNVAGSDGEHRQIGKPTHLVRMAARAAAGKQDGMVINGDDYDTPDGTCYRDYVHVEDLVGALTFSVDNIAKTDYECISTGKTFSNLEVVATMQRVTGKDFPVKFGPRRAGDPPIISAPNVSKYFTPTKSLEDMCMSAYVMELLND